MKKLWMVIGLVSAMAAQAEISGTSSESAPAANAGRYNIGAGAMAARFDNHNYLGLKVAAAYRVFASENLYVGAETGLEKRINEHNDDYVTSQVIPVLASANYMIGEKSIRPFVGASVGVGIWEKGTKIPAKLYSPASGENLKVYKNYTDVMAMATLGVEIYNVRIQGQAGVLGKDSYLAPSASYHYSF